MPLCGKGVVGNNTESFRCSSPGCVEARTRLTRWDHVGPVLTRRSRSGRSASEKPTSPLQLRTVHFGRQRIAERMLPRWRSAKSQRSYTWSDVHSACSAEDWPPDAVVHRCKALQPVCIPHLVYRRGPRVSQLVLDDHRRVPGPAMRSQQEHLP